MALTEIEFELPALQHERMGYPPLKPGETLDVILDVGVLLPDTAADTWFAVQKETLPARFVAVGPATYAFCGQIQAADIVKDEGVEGEYEESATLLVMCGNVPLRVTCAPQADGRLPYGTWETRYLTGYGRIQGIVEEAFSTPIGQSVGVTIWRFRRLVLTPGDAVFGEWRTTDDLPSAPYQHDRVLVTAHLHHSR
ncbi:MAG: hypothetical protein M3Q45_09425 [Chloroflexota bacterium]|nr:hypothetical protein [Chloroflexota bacterium]